MKLTSLPARNDLEPLLAMFESLGWAVESCSDHVVVRMSSKSTPVEVSAISYKLCGMWMRPIYTKIKIVSSIDFNKISSILLLHTFDELVSVSISDWEEETKLITLCCRLLIPSEPAERAYLAEAIMAATFNDTDMRKILTDMIKGSSNQKN
jgi:hypothetical protein